MIAEGIHYRAQFPGKVEEDTENLLHSYFYLDISLPDLYKHWSTVDPHFKTTALRFAGVRILRQDPWECLVGFICSSNNNIARITQMMEKLCIHYGTKLGTLNGHVYYDFPAPNALAHPSVEQNLRRLGFGYRAKYIQSTAHTIAHEKPKGWLHSLRGQPYSVAKESLLGLSGVGAKVADCVVFQYKVYLKIVSVFFGSTVGHTC